MQSAARQFIEDAEEYDLYGYNEEQEQLPEQKLTVTRSRFFLAGVSRIRLAFCAAMVVAVLSLTIYNNVAMIELGDRVNQQNAALSQLTAQGEQLQSSLDNAISLSEVADYTSQHMLMGKTDEYQITYITLSEGDKVKRTTKTPDQHPLQKVITTVHKLQAYMRSR
ncbi:MAG: hypothetical protein RR209_00445 [Angelakisella sp.]